MELLVLDLVACHADVPTTCGLAAVHRNIIVRKLDIQMFRALIVYWRRWQRMTKAKPRRQRVNSWSQRRRYDENAPLLCCG